MPDIGEIRKGTAVGYKYPVKYIWCACPDCGKERWVQYAKGAPTYKRCLSCAQKEIDHHKSNPGTKNPHWKGGRVKNTDGYIKVWLSPDDFFYPMVESHSRVREHRLVMAKSLGRCLHRWEIVHHINHIRDDNRIENLQLVQEMQHRQITIFETKIKHLEQRVTLLEAENALLKGLELTQR